MGEETCQPHSLPAFWLLTGISHWLNPNENQRASPQRSASWSAKRIGKDEKLVWKSKWRIPSPKRVCTSGIWEEESPRALMATRPWFEVGVRCKMHWNLLPLLFATTSWLSLHTHPGNDLWSSINGSNIWFFFFLRFWGRKIETGGKDSFFSLTAF